MISMTFFSWRQSDDDRQFFYHLQHQYRYLTEYARGTQSILSKQKLSRHQLAEELDVHVDVLGAILDGTGSDNVAPWLAVYDRLVHVLRQNGQLHQGVECEETTSRDAQAEASADPFAGAGEEVSSEGTRLKVERLAWADGALEAQ